LFFGIVNLFLSIKQSETELHNKLFTIYIGLARNTITRLLTINRFLELDVTFFWPAL